jgi:hypothetical protein
MTQIQHKIKPHFKIFRKNEGARGLSPRTPEFTAGSNPVEQPVLPARILTAIELCLDKNRTVYESDLAFAGETRRRFLSAAR